MLNQNKNEISNSAMAISGVAEALRKCNCYLPQV